MCTYIYKRLRRNIGSGIEGKKKTTGTNETPENITSTYISICERYIEAIPQSLGSNFWMIMVPV